MQAGIDYDLLDCHHLSNCHRKSPSPTFLTGIWSGNHRDDCSSMRFRFSNKAGDGETVTAVLRSHDAAVVVPRSCEASGAVLRPHDGAATVSRLHEDA